MIHIVLVGNQNCGKTTLFNALTGLDQHTGNWPGVTVARKAGPLRDHDDAEVIDLPGTYSLHPYTEEESVTRDVLLEGAYDCIVNVADATCLARSLYLTMQLLTMHRPVVLALNMMDEVTRQGMRIDIPALSRALGISVIPMTARTGEGTRQLVSTVLQAAKTSHRGPINVSLPHPAPAQITATYQRIDAMTANTITFAAAPPGLTVRLDHILLRSPLGLPILLLVLLCVFMLAFGPLSSFLQQVLETFITRAMLGASTLMHKTGVSPWLQGLVTDGLLTGVGSVLSFLPTILLLLTGLSLLEDSGLMARAVYLLDRPLRRVGLSGRAFIPLLLGFGCTVPAAMATRSMPGRRERILTTLLLPFMSCGAKLPVYALFVQAFFPEKGGVVMIALYLGSILLALALAKLIGSAPGGRGAAPLLMELPTYRLPTMRSVLRGMAGRAGEFLRRACTVILLATVAVWGMQHFTPRLTWASVPEDSLLIHLAGLAVPILTPLGFATPEAAAALMTGILAKESIISTLTVLCGSNGLESLFSTGASALSFLVFILLYTPCVTALTAMGESLGRKRYALYAAIWQFGVAWLAAWSVYAILMVR